MWCLSGISTVSNRCLDQQLPTTHAPVNLNLSNRPSRWQVDDMKRRVQRLEAEMAEQKEARRRRQAAIPKTQEQDVEVQRGRGVYK